VAGFACGWRGLLVDVINWLKVSGIFVALIRDGKFDS
jgi:hypothetical protein